VGGGGGKGGGNSSDQSLITEWFSILFIAIISLFRVLSVLYTFQESIEKP